VTAETASPPTGIEDRHIAERRGLRGHASPIPLVLLAVVVGAGLFGLYGAERVHSSSTETATLEVQGPYRIRNGEFFEMRFHVEAHEAIAEPVIGIDSAIWEDMTMNTLVPAPSEEESADGEFLFTFAPLEAGDRLEVKIDLQINPDHPIRTNRGAVRLLDGEEPITEVEYELGVLP
jgi:hypothetical protein